MEKFIKFLAALLNVAITLAVLLGIPYVAGNWGWLMVSWIPALLVFAYLADTINDL